VPEIGGACMPRTWLRLRGLREIGSDEPRPQRYLANLLRRLAKLSGPLQKAELVEAASLASKRRKDQRKHDEAHYQTRLKSANAQARRHVRQELITHRLSRLHAGTPPEKDLRTTNLSATNPSWKDPCRLTRSASNSRLAPT
jgi:hypothetical protein